MNIENTTPYVAETTVSFDSKGAEIHLVVVKGTFDITDNVENLPVAGDQRPLVYADEYYGDAEKSSILEAYDFAPFKPRTDVVLVGSAWAPRGKKAKRVDVRLQVGNLIDKALRVSGDRVWHKGAFGNWKATEPRYFTQIPLVYERSFGGVDTSDELDKNHKFHRDNLIGKGMFSRGRAIKDRNPQLPNIEYPNSTAKFPGQVIRTAGTSFICPQWTPRVTYAGTYDERWLEERFPFLPDDFDENYHQSAPIDQIVDAIEGGEEVKIFGVHQDGPIRFLIPIVDIPITFLFTKGKDVRVIPKLDTVVIWTDEGKLTLVWRASVKAQAKLYSLRMIVVGHRSKRWIALRRSTKPYFKNLGEYIKWRALH